MKYYQVEGKINGILADLGVSSHQFDDPERGFFLPVRRSTGYANEPISTHLCCRSFEYLLRRAIADNVSPNMVKSQIPGH
jgi:hypothetical protein